MGYREDLNSCKKFTFKMWDVQQLAEQNFAFVITEEWALVCRHIKAVEEEYMSRGNEIDSVMEES